MKKSLVKKLVRMAKDGDPEALEAVDVAIGEVSTFGIGFAKDNQQLRDEVQKVLNEMKADGTMAKISEKWFGKDITKK